MRDQFYREGVEAHKAGAPIRSNPYRWGSHAHTQWSYGWKESKYYPERKVA